MKGINNLLTISLIICLACSDDTLTPENVSLGYDYFPLQVGHYREYDIKQIDFTVTGSDTSIFQLKEVVADSFLNTENDYTYILKRFTRPNKSLEWKLDSVWTTRRTNALAIVTENNVSVVKLVFPVVDDKEWDGNSLNSKPEELFRIEKVAQPVVIGDTTFMDSVTIIQSDKENDFISQDERSEIYIRGVGLAAKNYIVLEFCSKDSCLLQGIIDSGQILTWKLIDYGKE